jgi:hypothetical protein
MSMDIESLGNAFGQVFPGIADGHYLGTLELAQGRDVHALGYRTATNNANP